MVKTQSMTGLIMRKTFGSLYPQRKLKEMSASVDEKFVLVARVLNREVNDAISRLLGIRYVVQAYD